MDTRRARNIALVATLAVVACLAAHPDEATGQARNAFGVGSFRGVGSQSEFGSANFQRYSYGLGGSRGPAAAGPAGATALHGSRSIRRPGAVSAATGGTSRALSGSSSVSSRTLYRTNAIQLRNAPGGLGGTGAMGELSAMVANRVRLGQTVSSVFGLTESPLLTDEPITTFAPDNTGKYATYIRTGEDRMKIRQYILAEEQFRRANYIGSRRPETLLSLAHAYFAQGKYSSMTHHLRLTIQYFPELAGKDIQVRRFFRDSREFVALREKLAAETQRWPEDADAWMASAYIHWFDGNVQKATEAMRQVVRTSTDPRLTDAAEVLWDSCVATGKVTGSVLEERRPTSRPAAPTDEPAEQPDPTGMAEAPPQT